MTQKIKVMYRNILENSTVTSTDENASFPLYRTYDRDIGKLFKFNSHPANLFIQADQGVAIEYPVSRLIIPVGHTLNGLNCKLQYSHTGAWAGEQTDALSWAQTNALIIDKAFTEFSERYWRLLITSDPAAPPALPELFLTKPYQFVRNVSWGFTSGNRLNVNRLEALSGKVNYIMNGVVRKERGYQLTRILDAQKTEFDTWQSTTEGIRGLYIEDQGAAVYFAEVLTPLLFTAEHEGRWGVTLSILEKI